MPSADPNASSRIPAAHLGGFGTPGASFSYSYSNGFLRDASPSQHTNTQASRRTYAALGYDVPRVSPFPDMSGVPPAGNAQFMIHDPYSMASTLQTGQVTDHPPYDHQMTVPRPHRPCPSRSALASLIAREFQRFLDREKNEGRVLRYLGKEVTLQNLALLEVKHVSRASVQPVICLVGL
ncbi:hypothetical protein DICSQDRAFT_167533 [Dichomitus squalens LYAD-421 SS1]|uniref:uncharacterized protein n=1 Tax=Dichomitus squalens (strain LYAD-421) TaxID=732165 RepID=UPI00044154E7|nr:uncharacterized protein DICSQDRAFT_167533 [Dichomitus squalens LYAD-421 SS1]EJF64376.1 hypothetical protein DICSQDRAFT_167533 [Dichomitus squalens LYAD-421 SS1]